MVTTERKYWMGSAPGFCDTCDAPITDEFYDMATIGGRWANMCPCCALKGPGIGRTGVGLGQHYKQETPGGKFYKVAG
jgi:hypothetical protein